MTNHEELLKELLKIGVVSLKLKPEDFYTWSSGVRSPIYCDNRKTISFPTVYKNITQAMVDLIQQNHPQTNCIAATATAAIPLAAWIANACCLPLVYVRSSPKQHGKKEKMEGVLPKNPKVVVIEDLISTGKSVLNTVETLEEKNAQVLGVYAIFNYEIPSCQSRFFQRNLPLFTLLNFPTLVAFLKQSNQLNKQEEEVLKNWKRQLDQTTKE